MSLKSVMIQTHDEELSRSFLKLKLSEDRISNKTVSRTDTARPASAASMVTSCKEVSLQSIHIPAGDATPSGGLKSNSFETAVAKECEAKGCKCAQEFVQSEKPVTSEATDERQKDIIKQYEERINYETTMLKDRFNLILRNEEIRTSALLREAYRERQEKIAALKTQLECKNLAGLMYVMCSERHKSRLEKMRIVEEYTNYIDSLREAILEGQNIMAEMSSGCKVAAQVDVEWRDKMKNIVGEFQKFLEHYYGSRSECSRYFFNLPQLLQICAPLEHPPEEQPVICEGGQTCDDEDCVCSTCPEISPSLSSSNESDTWWGRLQASERRPFVVFGDMADFPPQRRRELLRKLKNDVRPPPERWQQYAFNNRFLLAQCPNAVYIKDEYMKHVPKNNCDQSQGVQTMESPYATEGQRLTGGSFDLRHGPMGSLLKTVTEATEQSVINKASVLAARDSLELASTTKLQKEKRKRLVAEELGAFSEELGIRDSQRKKRTSIAPDAESRIIEDSYGSASLQGSWSGCDLCPMSIEAKKEKAKQDELEFEFGPYRLGSLTHDSLELVPISSPERNDKIGYEKECPDVGCQRKHVTSFMRGLPPYMSFTSPFKEYEPSFDNYEPCTIEQLERLVATRGGSAPVETRDPSLGADDFSAGVYVQTSTPEVECVCSPPAEECELLPPRGPSKKMQDHIPSSQLFDGTIEFDRFRVLGAENGFSRPSATQKPQEFTTARAESIMKILKYHPSMLSLFQAAAKC